MEGRHLSGFVVQWVQCFVAKFLVVEDRLLLLQKIVDVLTHYLFHFAVLVQAETIAIFCTHYFFVFLARAEVHSDNKCASNWNRVPIDYAIWLFTNRNGGDHSLRMPKFLSHSLDFALHLP